MAILLYEQFIHLTNITLRPNIQLLSDGQHAYQSFLVTSWFYTVCKTVTRRVNFREKHLHEHELQLSDYNIWKHFRPSVQISGRKIYLYNFCL